jgi:hypothetical protein|nr:MAG TPA: hypothetical protein [Caudoviricetes sp.]
MISDELINKGKELFRLIDDIMSRRVNYIGVGSDTKKLYKPYGDADDIGTFTISISFFKDKDDEYMNLSYIMAGDNDDNGITRFNINVDLPSDFKPEITSLAVTDTWLGEEKNIQIIK